MVVNLWLAMVGMLNFWLSGFATAMLIMSRKKK